MSQSEPQNDIRVLLADDQDSVLASLKVFLETESGISVIGLAKDGLEALEQATKLLPHVVIMDVKMPKMDGIEATRQLKRSHPEMRVILLSIYDNEDFIQEGKKAGTSGYFVKGTSTEKLICAIKG